MPYIKKEDRPEYDEHIEALARTIVEEGLVQNPGNVNYVITKLLCRVFLQTDTRYRDLNALLGAIEGAKLEFYRRVGAQLEDAAIAKNGDLF